MKRRHYYCLVNDCFTRETKSRFGIPKNIYKRKQWLQNIGREDLLLENYTKLRNYIICSKHFKDEMFFNTTSLKFDAVPFLEQKNDEIEKIYTITIKIDEPEEINTNFKNENEIRKSINKIEKSEKCFSYDTKTIENRDNTSILNIKVEKSDEIKDENNFSTFNIKLEPPDETNTNLSDEIQDTEQNPSTLKIKLEQFDDYTFSDEIEIVENKPNICISNIKTEASDDIKVHTKFFDW